MTRYLPTLRTARIAFTAFPGLAAMVLCASQLSCNRESNSSRPPFEAIIPDPATRGTLPDYLPSWEKIETVTISNRTTPRVETSLTDYPAKKLSEAEWREWTTRFKDTTPVRLQLTTQITAAFNIRLRDGSTTDIKVYSSDLTGVIYQVFTDGANDYKEFSTSLSDAEFVKLLPPW